ncbi:MAG TPA: metal-dependent hydrolase [Salinimicrobium sp.]|nr:metal-dependent hydrolase [Salinimicrobium sp.]
MDSLTQMVLGAAVGEAVLGRKVGNKAVLYGAIAGTIPDLDTFAGYFVDPVTAIEIHRGFTHSIFFSVVFAPIFGWLISKIEKRTGVGWKSWSKLVFWSLITHPLLDSFTTWGTELFWPLNTELAFKSIFVIDPLYTLPFLIFLILAMRQNRSSEKRREYNRLGLIISSSYLLLALVFKGIAYQQFEDSLESSDIVYKRMETKPSPFNIILWTAHAEVEDAYLIGDYSFFDDQPIDFTSYPKNHHYLDSLGKYKKVQELIEISGGWFTIIRERGEFVFNDLRFGKINPYDPNSSFVFSYRLIPKDGGLTVKKTEKGVGKALKMLKDLWERIKGN